MSACVRDCMCVFVQIMCDFRVSVAKKSNTNNFRYTAIAG